MPLLPVYTRDRFSLHKALTASPCKYPLLHLNPDGRTERWLEAPERTHLSLIDAFHALRPGEGLWGILKGLVKGLLMSVS